MALDYYQVVLGIGDEGDDVLMLQRTLRLCGFMNPEDSMDSDFGAKTAKGVDTAEDYFGQAVDSTCGPILWKNLYDYVWKIQHQINVLFGKGIAEDGNIGSHGTETTVTLADVQAENGGTPDAIMGGWTENLLQMVDYMRGSGEKEADPSVPSGGSGATTEASSRLSGKNIAVKNGHRNGEPGACANGMQEYELCYEVGWRLCAKLSAAGADVLNIRPTMDDATTLESGIEMVNAWDDEVGCDLFISIHHNAVENSPETQYTTAIGYYDSPEGLRAAQIAINYVSAALDIVAGSVIDRDDWEVELTQPVAFISEACFVTCPDTVDLMYNRNGFEREAQALFDAICEYFGV